MKSSWTDPAVLAAFVVALGSLAAGYIQGKQAAADRDDSYAVLSKAVNELSEKVGRVEALQGKHDEELHWSGKVLGAGGGTTVAEAVKPTDAGTAVPKLPASLDEALRVKREAK